VRKPATTTRRLPALRVHDDGWEETVLQQLRSVSAVERDPLVAMLDDLCAMRDAAERAMLVRMVTACAQACARAASGRAAPTIRRRQ
jgi:hypothetical protein